jgi:hypothetical protein
VALTNPLKEQTEISKLHTRRKNIRYPFPRQADWDFFTEGTGTKPGYIENVSQGGCLLRTMEPIEHRRWIRFAVKEEQNNLWFTSVGRIVRREDKMEPWGQDQVTLYRYGVELIHGMNPLVLSRIKESSSVCTTCGSPNASIPDLKVANRLYCVLCHLRRACQSLLVQEGLEPA